MFYQIANTAPLEFIETNLDLSFKYKHLYSKRKKINGLNESMIEVITSDHKDQISFAIWGMIPIKFEKDWQDFQQITNTLTTSIDQWKERIWYSEALGLRRCIIISTGFYTYAINEGKVLRYFVQHATDKLLLLGGICNELDDGFISCSLLTKKARPMIKKAQKSVDIMPLLIDRNDLDVWLDEDSSEHKINELLVGKAALPLDIHLLSSSQNHQ